MRVGVSRCRPSRGIHFPGDHPPPGRDHLLPIHPKADEWVMNNVGVSPGHQIFNILALSTHPPFILIHHGWVKVYPYQRLKLIREWSLFTAGGAGGIPKIARTQNVPPLNNRALHFCPPPPNLCTEILPPPLSDHTYLYVVIHYDHSSVNITLKYIMKMGSH